MSDVAFILIYLAIGIAFGCILVPFAELKPRTFDNWISFAMFWPFIAFYYAWLAIRSYCDVWVDYKAKQRHMKSKMSK